jgi:hypothetical protein
MRAVSSISLNTSNGRLSAFEQQHVYQQHQPQKAYQQQQQQQQMSSGGSDTSRSSSTGQSSAPPPVASHHFVTPATPAQVDGGSRMLSNFIETHRKAILDPTSTAELNSSSSSSSRMSSVDADEEAEEEREQWNRESQAHYMSVVRGKRYGSVSWGVCYFSEAEDTIYASSVESMAQVKRIQSTLTLRSITTNLQSDDPHYAELKNNEFGYVDPAIAAGHGSHQNEPMGQIAYPIATSKVNFDKSVDMLKLLTIENVKPAIKDPTQSYSFLSSLINIEDRSLVQSVGALVTFLLQHSILTHSHAAVHDGGSSSSSSSSASESKKITITDFKEIPSTNVLRMDSSTVRGLSIFRDDFHPSMQASSKQKEGVSVFGLLSQFTTTTSSTKMLRAWLATPSADLDVILTRHTYVDFFASPANADFVTQLRAQLRNVKDIKNILRKFSLCNAKFSDYKLFMTSLRAVTGIAELIGKIGATTNAQPPSAPSDVFGSSPDNHAGSGGNMLPLLSNFAALVNSDVRHFTFFIPQVCMFA